MRSRNKIIFFVFSFVVCVITGMTVISKSRQVLFAEEEKIVVPLPPAKRDGPLSLESAIDQRRSVREYQNTPLTLQEVSQVLWSAQGITSVWGGRAAPSAGATYPLEIYLVVGQVEGIDSGLYHYRPNEHAIVLIEKGDRRGALMLVSLFQGFIKSAPLSIVICARPERTTQRYAERGKRYIDIEVGHVGQNIYLQAESLGLGTVAIGAFVDEGVKKVLGIDEEPIYIMPIGRRQ